MGIIVYQSNQIYRHIYKNSQETSITITLLGNNSLRLIRNLKRKGKGIKD